MDSHRPFMINNVDHLLPMVMAASLGATVVHVLPRVKGIYVDYLESEDYNKTTEAIWAQITAFSDAGIWYVTE